MPLPRERNYLTTRHHATERWSAAKNRMSPSIAVNQLMKRRDYRCRAYMGRIITGELSRDDAVAMQILFAEEQFSVEEDGQLVNLSPSASKAGTVFALCVVPLTLRPLVLKLARDDPTASHGGVTTTHARLLKTYWWPGMQRDVRDHGGSCIFCLRRKHGHTKQVFLTRSGLQCGLDRLSPWSF